MEYKKQILVSWKKKTVISLTWKCFGWNCDGTEKGWQFLGLKKEADMNMQEYWKKHVQEIVSYVTRLL